MNQYTDIEKITSANLDKCFTLIDSSLEELVTGKIINPNEEIGDIAGEEVFDYVKFTYHDTYYIALECYAFLDFIVKRNIEFSNIFSSEFKKSMHELIKNKLFTLKKNIECHYNVDSIDIAKLCANRYQTYCKIFDHEYVPSYFAPVDPPQFNSRIELLYYRSICALSTFAISEISDDVIAQEHVLEVQLIIDIFEVIPLHILFLNLHSIFFAFFKYTDDSKTEYMLSLCKVTKKDNPYIKFTAQTNAKPSEAPKYMRRKILIPICVFFASAYILSNITKETATPPTAPSTIAETTTAETVSSRKISDPSQFRERTVPAHLYFYTRGHDVTYGDDYEDNYAPLTFNLPKNNSVYFIKITNVAPMNSLDKLPYSFIAKSDKSPVHINIACGTYEISYATGSTWYGFDGLFGPDGEYCKLNGTFEFSQEGEHVHGHEITLYKVSNGNLDAEDIPYEDF